MSPGPSPQRGTRRPANTVVVTGTGTEVGKTWVSASVLAVLIEAGVQPAARKPAQSFDPDDDAPRDADVLAGATGEAPGVVCPPHRNYAVAMAPPMAADALGAEPILVHELMTELEESWPEPPPQLALVELAGGVRSPIADDADCADFITMLDPSQVVLVADAGLGTINAVMSALDSLAAAARDRGGRPDAPRHPGHTTVYLNRFDSSDELHRRNRDWLADHGCGPLPVTPLELARHLDPRV